MLFSGSLFRIAAQGIQTLNDVKKGAESVVNSLFQFFNPGIKPSAEAAYLHGLAPPGLVQRQQAAANIHGHSGAGMEFGLAVSPKLKNCVRQGLEAGEGICEFHKIS